MRRQDRRLVSAALIMSVGLIATLGVESCATDCQGKWGVIDIKLSGISYDDSVGMTGELIAGKITFFISCPGVASDGPAAGTCSAGSLTVYGWNVDVGGVREVTVTLATKSGISIADHVVVPVSGARLVHPHDATPFCESDGSL